MACHPIHTAAKSLANRYRFGSILRQDSVGVCVFFRRAADAKGDQRSMGCP